LHPVARENTARAEVSAARVHSFPVCWIVAGLLASAAISRAEAQVVLPPIAPTAPPWNVQQVFDPLLYPQWWDPDRQLGALPEDTPVKIRQQPGYEPVGMRFGSWMFDPSVTAGALYDSNVFASNTNPRGDVASLVTPSLRVHSLGEQHQLDLLGIVQSYSYLDHAGLDQTNANVSGRGRVSVRDDIDILTTFNAGVLHEGVGSLTSPTGAVAPTPYSLFSGDVTYRQEFGRVIASLGTRIDSYKYGTTHTQDGTVIDQSSRDGQIHDAHGRIDYTFSPTLGLFMAADANRRDLRGTPDQPLSSDGYRVLAGVDAEFTHLITGELGAGFVRQHFDAVTIGNVEGPTYRALLTWSPTRTVDVWFKAEQIITEATLTDASGIQADALVLGLDYELRRNVIFSTSATYENDRFHGQPRVDNVFATYAELRYQLNRYATISLRHSYTQRESNIPIDSYSKHQVGLNVTVQF
jgi:hypothetical protein